MRTTGRKAQRKPGGRPNHAPRSYGRPKALICKAGPEEVLDACLMWIGREADIEQVTTLAEAMKRCLNGEVDILFVNLFAYTAGELTALAAFRDLRPDAWVVAVGRPEMRPVLLGAGLADEVFTVTPVPQPDPSWA